MFVKQVELHNYCNFIFLQAVDECGRLFIVDSGIVNALTNLQQLCPPKIVVFDLATDQQVLSYALPSDQVLQGSLHTNIVVDVRNGECNRAVVYIFDVWRNGKLSVSSILVKILLSFRNRCV